MRTLFYAIVGLVLFTATSANAVVEFRGGFFVTAANAACIAVGNNVGDFGAARFRPNGVSNNGPHSKLSLFYTVFASNYTRLNNKFVNSFKNVDGTSVGFGGFTFAAQVKIKMKPKTPTASTKFVTMEGSIKDYTGDAGCDIDFRAALTRRP